MRSALVMMVCGLGTGCSVSRQTGADGGEDAEADGRSDAEDPGTPSAGEGADTDGSGAPGGGLDTAQGSDTDPDPDPPATDASRFLGAWTGTWRLTTPSTSTGAASVVVVVDASTGDAVVTLDLDGNVFGDVDPDAVDLRGPYATTGFTVEVIDEVYGPMSITFGADGSVEGEARPQTGADETLGFTGSATDDTMTLDYAFTDAFSAVTAEGRIRLTKP